MSLIRILVAGDLHGNGKQAAFLAAKAGERKIQHILVVGDVGLWTHEMNGHVYLDELQRVAEGNNLSFYLVGGNHENWDHWEWYCKNMPTHKGFAIVRSRVLLAPKVHSWSWGKAATPKKPVSTVKQFFVAGGAVSIDRDRRLMSERGDPRHYDLYGWKASNKGPRTEWWPNEQLTDEDVNYIKYQAVVTGGMVDYLFTHDCSDFTQFKNRIKPDPESQIHRKRIDEVLRMVNPKMHFHGHMHEQYDWVNTLGTGLFGSEPEYAIQTYGLEADFLAMHLFDRHMPEINNWGVLDTETDEFAFRGEGMNFRSMEKSWDRY